MKKLWIFFLFLSVISAKDVVSGYCENGAKQVSTLGVNSSTYVQRSYPACTVTVYQAGTNTLATIYSDSVGTPKANPFTAGADGFWVFYIGPSFVDVQLSGAGILTPFRKPFSVPGSTQDSSVIPGPDLIPRSLGSGFLDFGWYPTPVADGSTRGVPGFVAADFNSATGIISLDYTNGQKATAAQPGFLSAADWTAFNAKQDSGNYITGLDGDVGASGPGLAMATINPGVVSNSKLANMAEGTIKGRSSAGSGVPEDLATLPQAVQENTTRVGTLIAGNVPYSLLSSVPNAAADGANKGVAAFVAADFDASSGVVSLDYTNGQKADAAVSGFLSSTDWSAFDAKVPSTRTISTTAPLLGGGDLSANRTLSIADAVADGSTKGAAAFTATDFNTTLGIVSLDYANGQVASSSVNGFLAAADWAIFDGKVGGKANLTTVGMTPYVSASGVLTQGLIKQTSTGHLIATGTVPTISSGTLATESTDFAGRITSSTNGAYSGTLTFANAFSIAPVCTANNETSVELLRATSVSTTQVTFEGTTATNDLLVYICIGFE